CAARWRDRIRPGWPVESGTPASAWLIVPRHPRVGRPADGPGHRWRVGRWPRALLRGAVRCWWVSSVEEAAVAERSAIVAGGGIGGLATAIALSGRGWDVRVLERAPEFAEVGAGISLWSNALRALEAIGPGIADKVRGLGGAELYGGIQHRNGRWLTRADATELVRRLGPVLMLHRADLLRMLLDAVPPEALLAGTEVTGAGFDGESVTVTHTGGQ